MLLDTNVVSEAMRTAPDPTVVEWLDSVPASSVFLSAVTVAEIRAGLERLEHGLRRSGLETAFVTFLDRGFAGRILPFDREAADRYGRVVAHRLSIGRPIAVLDAQIASIAWAASLPVATRNVRDFDDCGVEILNPFGG